MIKALRGEAAAVAKDSKKDIAEKFLTHVVAHEVGHTLGLRHNFKGSLKGNVSSSVMDYLTDNDSVDSVKPGSYDIAAINYLNGFSKVAPTDKFCTDEFVRRDADCNTFDTGTDPWTQSVKPAYYNILGVDPVTGAPTEIDIFGFLFGLDNETHAYARGAQSSLVRADAFKTLTIPAGKIDPKLLAADPFYALWFDLLAGYALGVSYVSTPEQVAAAGIRITSPIGASTQAATIANCTNIIYNADKIRRLGSRVTCIAVLDKIHTPEALVALKTARAELDKPENMPFSTAPATERASFEALKAKADRVISNWIP
jgi:hypothetical protein